MSGLATAIRILGPRIPLMLKNGVFQSFGLTEESSKWDLKQAMIITTLRSIMSGSVSSVTQRQTFSLRDPGIKNNMWISKVTLQSPEEDDIRQVLFQAIERMNITGHETFTKPSLLPVEAEWSGHRAAAKKPFPAGLSEQDKYSELMKEVDSKVTVLYFHGGAYYMMDPASHRPLVVKLAERTKGRVLNVRYRLAPQNPFPAAVLDCLVAYLSLIYPPPGSFHEPVDPAHIIFAGDSAGGNMCLVLLLLLLNLKHTGLDKTQWHGKQVSIPLPGGVAPMSAWADLTHALPSWERNAHYDYLPARKDVDTSPSRSVPSPPACEAWPSDPPRADLYSDGSMMCHPLTSPLAARPEAWKDSPPLFFCYGEEMLADEGRVIAKRAAKMGVPVRFEGFEAMPHVFVGLFPGMPVTERCYESWADWMYSIVKGETPQTGGVWIQAKTLKEEPMDIESLIDISDEEVWKMMEEERERRLKEHEEGLADKETA